MYICIVRISVKVNKWFGIFAKSMLVQKQCIVKLLNIPLIHLGSHSYLHATRDVQLFFPNGLCCEQNSFTVDNKVHICMNADDTIDI